MPETFGLAELIGFDEEAVLLELTLLLVSDSLAKESADDVPDVLSLWVDTSPPGITGVLE